MTAPREFIAIDGEGVTRADGTHDYVLLCASDGSSVEQWRRGGLSTPECFDFLLELKARHPAAIFVAFGGSYDFQMMLSQVSREPDQTWERMRHNQYFTLRSFGRTYKIQTLFRHSLYVASGFYRRDAERFQWHKRESITVWDALGWFQQSFVAAVEAWAIRPPEWIAKIRGMKDQRATFDARRRAAVKRYCLEECDALAELMTLVAGTLADLGIRPSRWDGAGAGAAALLRSHHVDEHITRPADAGLERAQMSAYYGGRIQQLSAGVIDDPVYTFDLPSAYPEAIALLSALHGRWRHVGAVRDELAGVALAIVRVRWESPDRISPFPYRRDGTITWPAAGEGWYWLEEVEAVLAGGRLEFELLEAWIFTPDDAGARPFAFLRELIDRRLEWKRQGDAGRARLLKLVLNAIYGKLVQAQRDDRRKRPAFQSYIWGGMVTAAIRAKMYALATLFEDQCPRSVVAIATDGVFTTVPHIQIPGYDRGEIAPGLLIVQAGVMVTPRARYVRSRGFARTSITYDACAAAWDRDAFNAIVTVEERRFITADWATFVGDRSIWRTWRDIERDLTFATIPRMWPRRDLFARPGRFGRREPLYPPAAPEGAWALSEPYNPLFELPEREEWEYQRLVLEQRDVEIDDGAVR